ncbi:MAG: hypothetical protein KC431_02680, partial [Myxococcales bacterium]|nr:hypothetical protein [Myxococcales bacterium]
MKNLRLTWMTLALSSLALLPLGCGDDKAGNDEVGSADGTGSADASGTAEAGTNDGGCSGSLVDCNGSCVDITADNDNCGSCG